jgi:hypothetical protein
MTVPQNPAEVVAELAALRTQTDTLTLRLDETQASIAKAGGAASAADPSHVPGTLSAWRTEAGAFAFDDCQRQVEIEVDGVKQAGLAIRPGYLSASADKHVPADHREPRAEWRRSLGALAALDLAGWRGQVRSSEYAQIVDGALAAADRMPAGLRSHAAAYTRAHAERVTRQAGALSRREGAFIANTSGTGIPGADFINPEFIDRNVINVSSVRANVGLARSIASITGLHEDEGLKVRVIVSPGGFANFDSPKTDTLGTFPITNVETTTGSITGGMGVWAHNIADKDMRGDPRLTVDLVAMLLNGADEADMSADDATLLHGHKVDTAAAHQYASAGLAALAWDGRDANRSGTNIDPLIRSTGLVREAIARSATVNGVSGAGLSAATDWLSSQANFVKAHIAAKDSMDEQYRGGGLVLVISRKAADKLRFLPVTTTATGTPLIRVATEAERAATPLFVGVIADGTLDFEHSYMASGKWSTSGLVTGSGSIDAAVYVQLAVFLWVTGPDHGRILREMVPRTMATTLTRVRHKVLYCPVPTARKPVSLLFNVSAQS